MWLICRYSSYYGTGQRIPTQRTAGVFLHLARADKSPSTSRSKINVGKEGGNSERTLKKIMVLWHYVEDSNDVMIYGRSFELFSFQVCIYIYMELTFFDFEVSRGELA